MKKTYGHYFLVMALLAFAGIAIEILYAALLEPAIYGTQMQEWTTAQTIIHWVITCISWGIVAAALVRVSKNKLGFDLFSKTASMKAWQWAVVVVCIIFMMMRSHLAWDGFKVLKEF